MKSQYEVMGFARIAKAQLKKHPAADLPIGDDDKAALRGSIEERGMLQPLLVLDEPDSVDGMFLVVDGCNRLDSAPDGAELPCVMIQTDDPRAVALECLSSGRRRGPGQRIMVFLMMHKRDVLKAAELGAQIAAGKGGPVSFETGSKYGVLEHFSTKAIAERLNVCKEDVVRAVELFRCVELGLYPEVYRELKDERPLDLTNEDDVAAKAATENVFSAVLAGGTPVRKWKAAWGGRKKTTGPQGRPDVNHSDLFDRGLKHIRTVLDASAWHKISAVKREGLANLFSSVLKKLPDELKVRVWAFVSEEEARKKAEAEAKKKRIGA